MGVPAVTSDLAGFGRYVTETYQDPDRVGLKVLQRRGRTFQDSAADLAKYLVEFCKMERRDRIALRNEVDRRSWDFDWSKLGKAYHAAHDLALARFGQDDSEEVPMVSAATLAGRIQELKDEPPSSARIEPPPPEETEEPKNPAAGRVEKKSGTRP
jgi:hypothetical protein